MTKTELEKILKMGVETKNEDWNGLISQLARLAAIKSNDSILLCGASGTGKTTLAQRYYDCKKKLRFIKGALVEFNCAVMEENETLTALFGKGGALTQAAKGMLILDNPEFLSQKVQQRLLDAIKTGKYRPLNSMKETPFNILLVSTTNKGLLKDDNSAEFLSRIGMSFSLPTLKERLEDIPFILEYELIEYKNKTGISCRFTQSAQDEYLTFARSSYSLWSGNFKALKQSVHRMAINSNDGIIEPAAVKEEIKNLITQWHDEKLADKYFEIPGEKHNNIFSKIPSFINSKLSNSKTPKATIQTDENIENANTGLKDILDILNNLKDGIPDEIDVFLKGLDKFERVQFLTVYSDCLSSKSKADAGQKLFDRKSKDYNYSDRLKKYLESFEQRYGLITKWEKGKFSAHIGSRKE